MYKVSDLQDKLVKKDVWVKAMRKSFDPKELAKLIEKRITTPGSTGPYLKTLDNETATDIIDAMIWSDEEYRKKLTPAVGLILYNMLNDKAKEDHVVLRGVFAIIRESKLEDCVLLIEEWLNKYYDADFSDGKLKNTYREALFAYARIQPKDEKTKKWWTDLWRAESPFWWSAAFYGLRKQSPELAIQELPLLINRNLEKEKVQSILYDMWRDDKISVHFRKSIRAAIDSESGWAGYVFNLLIDRLTPEQREELILGLKHI